LELSLEQQQQPAAGSDDRLVSQDELRRSAHDPKAWKLKARLGEEKIKELEKEVDEKV